MEPSGQGGGAARGENLPGGGRRHRRAGAARRAAVYPSAGGEGLGRARLSGQAVERSVRAARLGNGLPAETGGPRGPSCPLRRGERGYPGPVGDGGGRGGVGEVMGRPPPRPALSRRQGSPQGWLDVKLLRWVF